MQSLFKVHLYIRIAHQLHVSHYLADPKCLQTLRDIKIIKGMEEQHSSNTTVNLILTV